MPEVYGGNPPAEKSSQHVLSESTLSNQINSHPFWRLFRYPVIPSNVYRGGLVCGYSVGRIQFLLSFTSI